MIFQLCFAITALQSANKNNIEISLPDVQLYLQDNPKENVFL